MSLKDRAIALFKERQKTQERTKAIDIANSIEWIREAFFNMFGEYPDKAYRTTNKYGCTQDYIAEKDGIVFDICPDFGQGDPGYYTPKKARKVKIAQFNATITYPNGKKFVTPTISSVSELGKYLNASYEGARQLERRKAYLDTAGLACCMMDMPLSPGWNARGHEISEALNEQANPFDEEYIE